MKLLLRSVATVLTLTLAGCGGGSSSTSTTPSLPFTAEQGIWSSAAGAANNMSAIVLIDGKVWALDGSNSSSQLLRGAFVAPGGNLTGSGKNYTLGTIPTVYENISLAASVIQKNSMNITVTASGVPVAYSLAYQSRYDTAVALTDFAATAWVTPLPSNVVLTWNIDNSGKIAGTSSTGCTYVGQLGLRAEAKAVVDAAVTQTCMGEAVVADQIRQFNGVAVRTAGSPAGMVMMLTTADGTEDLAVILSQ